MENEKVLTIDEFAQLLLVTLASNPIVMDIKDKNKKIVSLPIQYKQIIENILCAENGWRERFSVLIDIEEYFENHFVWERKLALSIKQFLSYLNKPFEYDFENDRLLINFTQNEIEEIMLKYPDEELRNIMYHFANLLINYIYTRDYQEKFHDYYASSVKKMYEMTTSGKMKVKSLF